MAIRKIVLIGDDVLRKKSREVEVIDKRILRLLDDMKDTLYENKGAGLAAPQVGILRRVVVADVGEGPIELINPILTEWSKTETQTDSEGCLSIPDRHEQTMRPMYVTVEAVGRDGKPFTIKASGLLARCLLHEIDHLNGVLYIDYENGDAMPK